MIQIKLWIGNEKEGIHKGLLTLFVGSNKISSIEIKNILLEKQDVKQIYFGAGGCTPINYNVAREIIDKNKITNEFIITLEVDIEKTNKIPKDILLDFGTEWIITVTHKKFPILNQIKDTCVQIKIQSVKTIEKCLFIDKLSNFNNVDTDELKGKIYTGDKVLR